MIEKHFKKFIVISAVLAMLLMATGVGTSLVEKPEEPTVQLEQYKSCHGYVVSVDTEDMGDYEYMHVTANDGDTGMVVSDETESMIFGVQSGDEITITAYQSGDGKVVKEYEV